jgi:D-proline reductase (dithiol) PrdB
MFKMLRSELMINTEALQRTYNKTREKWDPHFGWVVNDSAPWTPLQQPLAQTAVALVSTSGAYRREVDCPFDAANYFGDPSFKEIPIETQISNLDFAHTHYSHEHVSQDPNVAFPLDHLRALQADGVIARFVDPAISFSGFLPEPRQLIMETAPAAAQRLHEADAQAALLVPC